MIADHPDEMISRMIRARQDLAAPVVALSPWCGRNEMYFVPATLNGHGACRVLVMHPGHRWAAERLGLAILGLSPREPAAWTLNPLSVSSARLVAVVVKVTGIARFVRFLERALP